MKKNIETKKRYAVGFYNAEERVNNPEWMKNAGNRLMAYIYDEQESFNIRYKYSAEDGNRTWFILEPKELLKAKECFSHESTNEVIEWIDICNDYDKWKTSCTCCDSISINTIPYTYRDFGECVSKIYNCPMCSGLSNRMAAKIREAYNTNGVDSAIDLMIEITEGRYTDKEEKYYCSCCDRDIRFAGMIKDGKTIYKRTKKGGYIGLDIEQYNKEECELEYEIEGYYPCYYIEEDDNKKKGYTCFECNTKIEEELAKEILGE